jgi:hypothetical protein
MKIINHPRVAIIPKLFPKQFGGIQGIAYVTRHLSLHHDPFYIHVMTELWMNGI